VLYHILHTNKTKQTDIKLPFVARFRYIVAIMFLISRMENVAGNVHDVAEGRSRSVVSTAGRRPGTGPWHQLYRAARGSPEICRFNFLSNFHE